MFRAILATQWKWTRSILLIATCLSFALPLLSMRAAGRALVESDARMLLANVQGFGIFYAMSATLVGLLIAATVWTPDHAGHHVYALSLPVERWKYVAMRFGAGATTLAAPVVSLLIGALVAIGSVEVPAGLHVHPFALAIRFALAMLLAYALFFSIASGTKRTAGILLGIVFALILFEFIGDTIGIKVSPFFWLIDIVMDAPGLFGVFNSRWMLIDV
jgi:hypothetical protein